MTLTFQNHIEPQCDKCGEEITVGDEIVQLDPVRVVEDTEEGVITEHPGQVFPTIHKDCLEDEDFPEPVDREEFIRG